MISLRFISLHIRDSVNVWSDPPFPPCPLFPPPLSPLSSLPFPVFFFFFFFLLVFYWCRYIMMLTMVGTAATVDTPNLMFLEEGKGKHKTATKVRVVSQGADAHADEWQVCYYIFQSMFSLCSV